MDTPFEKVFKYKNEQKQEHVYFTATEASYKSIRTDSQVKPVQVSKAIVKGWLREFLNHHNLRNKTVRVAYITDEGEVYLNHNIITNGDITDSQIGFAMADPKTNVDTASGEYNNMLDGKRIYGLSIAILNNVAAKPATAAAKNNKNRSKFTFAF